MLLILTKVHRMKIGKTGILFFLVIVICFAYKPISSYVYKASHRKYGKSYNHIRAKLGIPLIEKGWVMEKQEYDAAFWIDKNLVKGHKRKTVSFDGFHLRGELDLYYLSKKDGKRRWIESEYLYKNDESILSSNFTYQVENSAKNVTLIVADSLLKADNIQR